MNKEKTFLLFNKNSGVIVGQFSKGADLQGLDFDQFELKEVEMDPEFEYWDGDYATGKIVSRDNIPPILESVLKYNTNIKILTEYPVHKQLNILIDMLDRMWGSKTEEFVAMKSFIDEIVDEHREKKQVYSSNPEVYRWVSQEEEAELAIKKTQL